jgi:hypothetical protein
MKMNEKKFWCMIAWSYNFFIEIEGRKGVTWKRISFELFYMSQREIKDQLLMKIDKKE